MRPGRDITTYEELWLPLLQELTRSCPSWLVWKNADEALRGKGDIDSTARPEEVHVAASAFASWAGAVQAEATFLCRHVPGKTLMFAVLTEPTARLLELDVMVAQAFRGATLVSADVLRPLAVLDPRGFRRLRPGAEALSLLLFNGIRSGGAADLSALVSKSIAERLRRDVGGVDALCRRLPPVRGSLARRLAGAVMEGRWDRGAALGFEGASLASAMLAPAVALGRARFRRGLKKGATCVLSSVAQAGRVIPPARLQAFLDQAAREHPREIR